MVSFIMVLVLNWNLLACQKQAQNTDDKAINMLRDFYTLFLSETCQERPDWEKVDSILKKYTTANLRKQWKELSDKMDYDLLIDGQFCLKEWIKTMKISKDETRDLTYKINFYYTLENKQMKKEVKLEVIEKDGVVLINKIILDR